MYNVGHSVYAGNGAKLYFWGICVESNDGAAVFVLFQVDKGNRSKRLPGHS